MKARKNAMRLTFEARVESPSSPGAIDGARRARVVRHVLTP